ncbi:recombinase family protein (plasmid) [Isosphaeraceae bacterium EP7]
MTRPPETAERPQARRDGEPIARHRAIRSEPHGRGTDVPTPLKPNSDRRRRSRHAPPSAVRRPCAPPARPAPHETTIPWTTSGDSGAETSPSTTATGGTPRGRSPTSSEIADILRDYHARLPRERADAIGCIYARYSTKHQDSIADQVRACCDAAFRAGVFVPEENVAFDLATSGRSGRRPGLARITGLLSDRGASVLLCIASSRLHRKQYRVLRFVEEVVVDCGARVILPANSIDTATPGWRLLFQIHGMIDEQGTTAYAANIRAAHVSRFERGMVCSSYPFGYRSAPGDGGGDGRGGARNILAVEPEAAEVVRAIFARYADGAVSIAQLVRDLNAEDDAPRPRRSPDGLWSDTILGRMLSNPIYRGEARYGATESIWSPTRDYSRQVRRAEPLRTRQDESLRIVDDDLFDRVQRRRGRRPAAVGRGAGRGDPTTTVPTPWAGCSTAPPTADRSRPAGAGASSSSANAAACRPPPSVPSSACSTASGP